MWQGIRRRKTRSWGWHGMDIECVTVCVLVGWLGEMCMRSWSSTCQGDEEAREVVIGLARSVGRVCVCALGGEEACGLISEVGVEGKGLSLFPLEVRSCRPLTLDVPRD